MDLFVIVALRQFTTLLHFAATLITKKPFHLCCECFPLKEWPDISQGIIAIQVDIYWHWLDLILHKTISPTKSDSTFAVA